MDLSRQRLDGHVLDEDGQTIEVTAVRPRVTTAGVETELYQDVAASVQSASTSSAGARISSAS